MLTPEIYVILFVIATSLAAFFYFKRTKANCGHKTRLIGKINAYRRTTKVKLEPNKDGDIEYCLKCLGDMTIKCASCENPIFIGEPVKLHSPKDDSFEVPEEAHIHKEDPLTVVVCRRMGCANAEPGHDGFWVPPGKIKDKSNFKKQSRIGAPKAKGGVVPVTY